MLCGNTGIVGWKAPSAGYAVNECQFCACPHGAKALEIAQYNESIRRQRDLGRKFQKAGIPAHFQSLTLDSLRTVAGEDPGKLPALAAVEQLLETGSIDSKAGLFLFGQYGTGKTGLVTPLMRNYLERGLSALWLEFYDFVDSIQARYGRNDGDSADSILEEARRCDVLLLDDTGDVARNDKLTGFSETEDRRRLLYQVVNYRHNHAKMMLFTSNLTPRQFSEQFGVRTFERIAESCAIVLMNGRNLRGTVAQ